MNYLQLATRLRQEAQISGTGPVTVLNQVGQMKLVVDWVNQAYEAIQNLHDNWDYLRTDFSFNTLAGVQAYSETAINLTNVAEYDLDSFRAYKAADGRLDEQYLLNISYDEFRDNFLFSNLSVQTGRPSYIARKPNNDILLYPIPDDDYVIAGEYYQTRHVLASDADEPLFKARFHMAIVYLALSYHAVYVNAPEVYSFADLEFKKILFKLEQDQTPRAIPAEPLV
jgi:hypothetical protein